MTVTGTDTGLTFNNITAGVPIYCGLKTFDKNTLSVAYGASSLPAVEGLDYSIELNPDNDFDNFMLTPTNSLLAKIGTGTNVIKVKRMLPYTNSFTDTDSFLRRNIRQEFDRTTMRFQQLAEKVEDNGTRLDALDYDLEVISNAADFVEAAEATTVVARDAAISAAGQSLLVFKNIAALAGVPAGALQSTTTVCVLGRFTPGSGGAGTLVRVNANPGHAASVRLADRYLADGVTVDNVNGGWMVFDEDTILQGEHCGRIGRGDAVEDTVTLQAWANALSIGKYAVGKLRKASIKINGRIVLNALADGAVLDFRLPTIAQQQRFMSTLFVQSTYAPIIYLGNMVGFAALDIAANPALLPSEWAYDGTMGVFNPANPAATRNVDSGHYTGVAAITVYTCTGTTEIYGGSLTGHAGGGVGIFESHFIIDGLKSRGIGATYINPIENGSDFAIWFAPLGGPAVRSDWEGEILRCDLDDHAFGIGCSHLGRLISHSHKRIACKGQHGHYLTEISNFSAWGFTVGPCPQAGVKCAINNDAGELFSSVHIAGEAITVGMERRTSHILYRATANFVTADFATELALGKWVESPKMKCYNHHVHDIRAVGCGIGVLYGKQGYAGTTNAAFQDVFIHDLLVRDGVIGLLINSVHGLRLHDINVYGMSDTGLFMSDWSGKAHDIVISNTLSNGINTQPIFQSEMYNITLNDCGGAVNVPFVLSGPNVVSSPLLRDSNPVMRIGRHRIFYTGGVVGTIPYLMTADPSYKLTIEDGSTNTNLRSNVPAVDFQTRNRYKFAVSAVAAPQYVLPGGTVVRDLSGAPNLAKLWDFIQTMVNDDRGSGSKPTES